MALVLISALALDAPAAAEKPPKPTAGQLQHADETLSLIVSALNAKNIPQDMKNGLFGCLYENSLKAISAESSAVFAKNPKLDAKDQNQRLLVIAKICGAPIPDATPAPDVKGR